LGSAIALLHYPPGRERRRVADRSRSRRGGRNVLGCCARASLRVPRRGDLAEYLGTSEHAPLVKSLAGRSVGETASLRDDPPKQMGRDQFDTSWRSTVFT